MKILINCKIPDMLHLLFCFFSMPFYRYYWLIKSLKT